MDKVQSRWAQGRRDATLRTLVAAGLTLGLAGQVFAQAPDPAPQQPAQPAPAQPAPSAQPAPGLTFDGDAGLILMQIKPDKTADFESVMAKLHEAFAQTDKPERKQQAVGWKIFKSTDPGPGGNILYVAVIDPTLKGADYTVAKILYEVFPTEVQALFPVYRDSFAAGLNRVNMKLVQDFGGPASAAPAAPASTTPPPAAPATPPQQ